MKRIFLILFMICFIPALSWAGAIQEEYKLRKVCAKDAANYFDENRMFWKGATFESHYNKTLNDCFIKIVIPRKSSWKHTIHQIHSVTEESTIAIAEWPADLIKDSYKFSYETYVGEKIICIDEQFESKCGIEWNQLEKKYMEQ